MKRAIWILAVLFLAGFDAVACTCDLPSGKQTLKQQVSRARKDSLAVFSGTVLRIEEAGYMLNVTLKVESSWKGLLPTEVVLLTGRGGGDCGYQFEIGQSYLVYAYGTDLDHLGTNICQRTVPGGGDDLKILGRPKHQHKARSGGTKPNTALDRSGGCLFLKSRGASTVHLIAPPGQLCVGWLSIPYRRIICSEV